MIATLLAAAAMAQPTSAADAPLLHAAPHWQPEPAGAGVAVEAQQAPDGTTTLVHEAVVAAPIEPVYAALATAEGWRTWGVPHAWTAADDPDLMETSYNPNGRQGDPANIRQRFLARVPHRLIVYRTVQAPPGFPHAEAFYRVTQIIELSAAGSGTRVRLTGAGYPAGTAGQALVGFFREGNRAALEALRRRFGTPPARR